MKEKHCAECGAVLGEGKTCRDYLETMITWDFEDFLGVGQVHHLTVLCYNLQHPRVYSQKGLEDAKSFLKEFVDEHISFEAHDKRNRERLSSNVRDWKITGTPSDFGTYEHAPVWTMHTPDIAIPGVEGYEDRVRAWSVSIRTSLEQSGNL
jgi:hypothetical protein